MAEEDERARLERIVAIACDQGALRYGSTVRVAFMLGWKRQ
jgi:hypothetical protein